MANKCMTIGVDDRRKMVAKKSALLLEEEECRELDIPVVFRFRASVFCAFSMLAFVELGPVA